MSLVPLVRLIERGGGSNSSPLHLSLAGYGVVVGPHLLLHLHEAWSGLVPGETTVGQYYGMGEEGQYYGMGEEGQYYGMAIAR